MNYEDFLKEKLAVVQPSGFKIKQEDINPQLFHYQRHIVRWAMERGRAAIFADCGLGKTLMELEWAALMHRQTGQPALLLTEFNVVDQMRREAEKFGYADLPITITNYQKLHHYSPSDYGEILLDESSILKGFDGKYQKALTEFAATIPYRLCSSATPSPNDRMELGMHAKFLGICTLEEMLAEFFTHDGGDTSKWRLKEHGRNHFYQWLASWAIAIRKPSDLGFSDEGFQLPPLEIKEHIIETQTEGSLVPVAAKGIQERRKVKKSFLEERIDACADLVNNSDEIWVIWCSLNSEAELLVDRIPDAVNLTGSLKPEVKSRILEDFTQGKIRVLVTKPKIAGFGLNWQHCHSTIFLLTDSYEQMYQALRRLYRFGQKHTVNAWIVSTTAEGSIVENIKRKEQESIELYDELIRAMQDYQGNSKTGCEYQESTACDDGWELRLGDCVEHIQTVESDSIHYSIFSPPFASLYTYSASVRDMGNCRSQDDFLHHFRFLVDELFRVLKPGRLLSFHCMNLPSSKQHDGVIGIKDFRGDLIWLFQQAGFIFHSEVCIWKDPVTAMHRTKSIGLVYKQLRKDSAMSRQGIPDYLVTMRKPGVNPDPVSHTHETFPLEVWQRYASPIWMDINPSDTLQRTSARENDDERHICPLQLEVIRRGIKLWTNPGDRVLSPFAGIGSEGYVAVKEGREFLGFELKPSYFNCAVSNLRRAVDESAQLTLFDFQKVDVRTSVTPQTSLF